ncbi:hypothetical protein OIU85_021692 [Salix viminalis]|uniref:Uncharacterized protein n=1 Tax=Salix viminalis TaxID=40686 RepID=A0A9Q0UIV9_SALVM|nr:hypothetical protein OIU85_021692 [Salix viminalis]
MNEFLSRFVRNIRMGRGTLEKRVGSEQCRVGGYGKEVENEGFFAMEEECCREKAAEDGENSVTMGEQNPKVVTFPMRHGKMKYKIHGLIFLIRSGLKLLIESMSQKSVIGQRNPSQYLGNAYWLPRKFYH